MNLVLFFRELPGRIAHFLHCLYALLGTLLVFKAELCYSVTSVSQIMQQHICYESASSWWQ